MADAGARAQVNISFYHWPTPCVIRPITLVMLEVKASATLISAHYSLLLINAVAV